MKMGTIYGVGLGPGDPDLMSVRADRLLRNAKHVAYFRKPGRSGQARKIVNGMIPEGAVEFPMEYPVTTEIPVTDPRYNELLAAFYEDCTRHLKALSERGEDVVVLCEGDPFFYGSFMHLYSRLRQDAPVEVVPAITGMSGAWTATGDPITWGDDVLTVLVGTLPEDTLAERMALTDALVVMKIGRNIDKVKRALKTAGLYDRAWIVEYAQMPNQTVTKLSEACEKITPYFSIIVVHGQGRRP
ncbi:precorrin-2 C(20)-methyltransferase [Ruegeria atlantica]|jgi:precorrin-2/cobalt-factor-2 C20-methyltransferase|uniref:Precorrin-2 C(20)-methyltransferase n=1 Tax=Ruegeria atlantica TaxID=81569 RepID=A0AA90YTI4_9RHOB|nr:MULTISPECIES: precorrin-2 C(20)-methyltransferase [Ruegeria]NOC81846.1 precorrin-2 C(20)-methyltransferase [Ruegeria sp. HKCCD6428]NOC92898.1 precorrin-2 C(20)-methyltransferase [Ruegeria sp. HKCCD6604]NOD29943.1 precorrin-2 C(20)-methyltransferase [Ruegeria atlantica]NOE17675.1 precorrin-2 C(20)-methyltransferase [Ruegeria atlantica]